MATQLNKRQLEIINTALINLSNQISMNLSIDTYTVSTELEEQASLNKATFINEIDELCNIMKEELEELSKEELK